MILYMFFTSFYKYMNIGFLTVIGSFESSRITLSGTMTVGNPLQFLHGYLVLVCFT
jgi:hypothetical protein